MYIIYMLINIYYIYIIYGNSYVHKCMYAWWVTMHIYWEASGKLMLALVPFCSFFVHVFID